MWKMLMPRLPYLGAPMALAMGFIVLFAALPPRGKGGDDQSGGPGTGQEAPAGAEDMPVEQHRNILNIFDYLNETVLGRTKNHIYPAQVAVESTSRLLSRYTSLVADPFLEQYCVDVLKQYKQIDNFYIADTQGSRVMASRLADYIEVDIIDRRGDVPIYYKKRGGRIISKQTEKEVVAAFERGETASGAYDPRVRPWYIKAKKEKKLCWSDVYIFASGAGDTMPGFTVSSPTLRPDGKILFVTAADFEVRNLSGFLRDLKIGMNGIAFILNGKEELIAYPEADKVMKREAGKVVLARAEEVLPVWAKTALAKFAKNQEPVFYFIHDGVRYIASFAPFLPSSGNGWRIAVVVPEEEFFNMALGAKKAG